MLIPADELKKSSFILCCAETKKRSTLYREQMSPKRIYYKHSKAVGYGPDQPTNGAALHQLRIRPYALDKHCLQSAGDNACCCAGEAHRKMRSDEFWSLGVTASKSTDVAKSTRTFQTVGVLECKGSCRQVAAVVRLAPDAQPGDVNLWLVKRLNFCAGCAAHRIDIFRLDEYETAAAIAATESEATAEEPDKLRRGVKKGERYANQHKVWELHLRCLLDEPGAAAEQILLKDLSKGGSSRLISNTLSADLTFPDATNDDVRQQLVRCRIDAILDGHTRNVLSCEVSAGLHPTLMPSADFMDILYDMIEEERVAKRSRGERDS
jgi:hypothetical protein